MSLDIFEKHITDIGFASLDGKTTEEQTSFCVNFLKKRGISVKTAADKEPPAPKPPIAGPISGRDFVFPPSTYTVEHGINIPWQSIEMEDFDKYARHIYDDIAQSVGLELARHEQLYGFMDYDVAADIYRIKTRVHVLPPTDGKKVSELLMGLKQTKKKYNTFDPKYWNMTGNRILKKDLTS